MFLFVGRWLQEPVDVDAIVGRLRPPTQVQMTITAFVGIITGTHAQATSSWILELSLVSIFGRERPWRHAWPWTCSEALLTLSCRLGHATVLIPSQYICHDGHVGLIQQCSGQESGGGTAASDIASFHEKLPREGLGCRV